MHRHFGLTLKYFNYLSRNLQILFNTSKYYGFKQHHIHILQNRRRSRQPEKVDCRSGSLRKVMRETVGITTEFGQKIINFTALGTAFGLL